MGNCQNFAEDESKKTSAKMKGKPQYYYKFKLKYSLKLELLSRAVHGPEILMVSLIMNVKM